MRVKHNLVDRCLGFSKDIQAKLDQLWRRSSLPRRSFPAVKQSSRPLAYQVELLEDRTMLTAAFPEFVDPNPSSFNGFGETVVALSTGNVVITSPYDDAGGTDAGAVYLFNGATGVLISTLTGSSDYDHVGMDGVTELTNGNFVVSSSEWANGAATEAGAVTFGNGTTGVSGVVSAANSLVGTTADDYVGSNDNGMSAVTALSNGNYVVSSSYWDNGTETDAGAVTFGNGTTGISGEVSALNSLVGSTSDDRLGYVEYDIPGVTALANGNYVVSSPNWDNATETDAGAVTFGNGSTGISGEVSALNSLVGSTSDDRVGYGGYESSAVTELTNGNYVVSSASWDNGAIMDAGAVTFGIGNSGVSGVISAANSLVGSSEYDNVGYGEDGRTAVTALTNGNYVVNSPVWNNNSVSNAGAVTFGNGSTGVSGVIASTNSLVGTTAYDNIGFHGVTALSNGNYVVRSAYWDNNTIYDAGAVTFGDGINGVSGIVSSTNSLVGSSEYDYVGYSDSSVSAVIELANGNYVVSSPEWMNGSIYGAGAVTFGNGSTGVSGVIDATNSLVGTKDYDSVGSGAFEKPGVIALSNGNYVVSSPEWDNGSIYDAGAVTFGDGSTGVTGVVSSANSLIGASEYDNVGSGNYDTPGVTALSNGNYVVSSPEWDNGSIYAAGAVTFGDGSTGVTGVVSSANSLVGASDYDYVGSGNYEASGVTALSNGNYVVSSSEWNNGSINGAGAVTFGDGVTGVSGVVSTMNSLVGASESANVGSGGVTVLTNGSYVVSSPYWSIGTKHSVGAVTFGNGTTGISGFVLASNSLIGSASSDMVGSDGVTALANGNYLVSSPYWDNGAVEDAGAVTFGNGTTGVRGVVSETNSLVGSSDYDNVGSNNYGTAPAVTLLSNGNYVVSSPFWDSGAFYDTGAVTFGNGTTGVSGAISSANSVTGTLEYNSLSDIIRDDINNNYFAIFPYEGKVNVVSQVGDFPPITLNEINHLFLNENAAEQIVNLTGIAASGFDPNQLSVTATSNNTSLIPDPIVSYTSPDTIGSLSFTPEANQSGVATITVTVQDGGADGDLGTTGDNGTLERTFNVFVHSLVNQDQTLLPAAFPEFVDPNPSADNGFGDTIVALSTGNVVITAPYDDAGGTDAGAVYLFNGATGALISTLTGSSDYDHVGMDGVTELTNGNFVVSSSEWANGAATEAGAVTFGNGTTGVSGVVSAANSLVGTTVDDYVGSNDNNMSAVTALANGNYVVRSSNWDNGAETDAGAVTFGNGNTGVSGAISASNSLVGSTEYDYLGTREDYDGSIVSGVTALTNGNYVVSSANWDNGSFMDAGAVTFGNGTTGISGVITSTNSLVGSANYDYVGIDGVTLLTNGNYVVSSSEWNNGSETEAGAVTFGDGLTGVSGVVSATNSLIGSTTNDFVGFNDNGISAVTALANGNYVVTSSHWNNGSLYNAGAVTFGNGSTGVSGEISASNSLVGSNQHDQLGFNYNGIPTVTALSNGNYVVTSPSWDNGGVYDAGAVTFGDGSSGVSGVITSTNSLVGSTDYDTVGFGGVTALTNGNYVVMSTKWNNGSLYNAGAVTFGNGTTGVSGVVSASNSLVGSTQYDQVGANHNGIPTVTALSNGNYVVTSPNWDNGGVYDAGAVTFGDGSSGVSGVITSTNSLVGTSSYNMVGSDGVTELTNGNYVVSSTGWSDGLKYSLGAVTFGDGTTGISGNVSSANSLVGASDFDFVGMNGVTALSNGNYVVSSGEWKNAGVSGTGAVTFGNGTTGVSGVITSANSLVGSTSDDFVGYDENGVSAVTALANGNYVVSIPYWDNGAAVDAGAVTFGNGTTGVTGVVSLTNSLVGSKDYDNVGFQGITALSTGNYVVGSAYWDYGTSTDAGAVTFGNGITGVTGAVSVVNSLVGLTQYDNVGLDGVTELSSGNYVVTSSLWDNGTITDAGAVTFGSGATGVSGRITVKNSATGVLGGSMISEIVQDNVNNTFFAIFQNEEKFKVFSQGEDLLATTLYEFIDPNPSLNNGFGDSVVALSTGNVVITAPYDDAGGIDAGAAYLFDGVTKELISTLTGSSNYDHVGMDGVTVLTNGNYVVVSSEWNNGAATEAGAVTFGNGMTGVSGVIDATNSLIGSTTDDYVGYNDDGTSAVTALANGNYVVSTAFWDNGNVADAGAVTFGNGTTGVSGVITSANSLVGSSENDVVGIDGVTALSNGNYVVVSSEWQNSGATEAGAVTFGDGTTGISGVVSAANSLVGTTTDDYVGYNDDGISAVTELSNGNYVVSSPYWDNGSVVDAGAVTFGSGTTGVSGEISASNSLVGSSENDNVGINGVTALSNGNYVVSSHEWDNGSIMNAGAVTYGNGTTGVKGVITDINSLVGATTDDTVGSGGITALANGNYVVTSSFWDNGSISDAGAVTFGDGNAGVSGSILPANSLFGTTEFDLVGFNGVTALSNGNYVVSSAYWQNGAESEAGAVTFGNGTTGVVGMISDTNSLVGSKADDSVGTDISNMPAVTELANGNYVVSSPFWDNGAIEGAGAVTFGDGLTGVSGVVSASNSLVGASENDLVGYQGVTALENGNYVVKSSFWNNGSVNDAGAVTFGNGTTGVAGLVSVTNSLVGSTESDLAGIDGVTALPAGNYLVNSGSWDNVSVIDAGAVTFGNGTTGVMGSISVTNSLVGSSEDDKVGHFGSENSAVTVLSNGNYVVTSMYWDNGSVVDAGAVTFGNGNTGVIGVVSVGNSLVGSMDSDFLGYVGDNEDGSSGVAALANGNYVVSSAFWDNGAVSDAGAVTFGDGTTGVSGRLTSNNSVTGLWDTSIDQPEIVSDDVNHSFFINFLNQGKVWVGSQVDGFPSVSLDEISEVSTVENAAEETVSLTDILASGFTANTLSVTATSSNPGLIPDPIVSYNSADSFGSLTFTPVANQVGIATITVTVEDGGLDGDLGTTEDNGTYQRTFDVIVKTLVDIDLRVVSSPSFVQTNGEASVLPDHQTGVHEWSIFWLEIWVNTTNVASQGIFSTSLDLSYNTEYISATNIEYGAGFTQNQTGTIDDPSGVIHNLSAETNASDLGVSKYLLFARVEFESLAEDHVGLDLENQIIGPYELELSVSTPQISLVSENPVQTNLTPFAGTNIWANPYDLTDNDQIDFRDLLLFASVYRSKPTESSNEYAWFSDFDQNDIVDFRDLMLFASSYRKTKVNNSDIYYPDNFPGDWNDQLIVAPQLHLQAQNNTAKSNKASLTQAEADQVLEQAIEQFSEHVTPAQSQLLSGVEVKVVDLAGGTLGRAVPGTIYLDVNAAGYGWFVDSTPLDHSEFTVDSQLSMIALPESAAAGRVDLWTVILHELGHLVGYDHEEAGVMEETLAPGVRHLPDWEESSDLFFASVQEEAELLPF